MLADLGRQRNAPVTPPTVLARAQAELASEYFSSIGDRFSRCRLANSLGWEQLLHPVRS
jgi:hypothetical protein